MHHYMKKRSIPNFYPPVNYLCIIARNIKAQTKKRPFTGRFFVRTIHIGRPVGLRPMGLTIIGCPGGRDGI
jgi:hypothetical protein